jgi:16S rRNA (cytidine1402-2'-O)-methyltransferase
MASDIDTGRNDGDEAALAPRHERAVTRAGAELARLLHRPLAAGLHLVATPIGNLGDITLRAIAVLARADVIYCEDTRHSRTLAEHFGLTAPLRPYHEHNGEAMRPRILAELAQGKRLALISDAGTPLVSDPGYKLVRDALAAGHHVDSLPGPSAVMTALTLSGLPTDTFLFAGFLPPRSAARRTRIKELGNAPATLVLFEAPQRLAETLADLAEVLGDRPAAVARELTKLHEETLRGTLASLAAEVATGSAPRGEIVILVAPPGAGEVSDQAIERALADAMPALSLRDASKQVADALTVSRSRVYDIGLRIKSGAK